MIFKKKPKQSLIARAITRVREYYLYCKVFVAERAATAIAQQRMKEAKNDTTPGMRARWERSKLRWSGRKFFTQAAICRYARRSGSYKNL